MPGPSTPARPVALVTGASAGIGRELAFCCADGGHDLVLVARNAGQLEAVAADCRRRGAREVIVVPKDLADPLAPRDLFDELQSRGTPVDVLVNNAGFGTHGAFADTDLEAELRMIQVNVAALTHLTKLFLRPMVQRRVGRVLNVASTAAFQPGPLMAVYYASKAYVLSFSEAIASELAGTGVTVTALCPGPTETEFQKRANIAGSRLFRGHPATAASVARAGYDGMMAGRTLVIPGLRNKLLAFAVRLGPRKAVARIAKSLNEIR